jgi:hypothetical protein
MSVHPELSMNNSRILAIAMIIIAMNIAGCGGGDAASGAPPVITTQILSDAVFDGVIEQTSPDTFTVAQGMSPSLQSVLAGIDPGTLTEFRTFLDFPLSGPAGIPGNARIESAYLDLHINNLLPITGTIPIRIELISFQPPTLIGTDFDRVAQPSLEFVQITPPFSQADVGTNVSLDVTLLMMRAQELQLADFQVRIMEDLGPAIVTLLDIDDSTGANRTSLAPLLTVTYY